MGEPGLLSPLEGNLFTRTLVFNLTWRRLHLAIELGLEVDPPRIAKFLPLTERSARVQLCADIVSDNFCCLPEQFPSCISFGDEYRPLMHRKHEGRANLLHSICGAQGAISAEISIEVSQVDLPKVRRDRASRTCDRDRQGNVSAVLDSLLLMPTLNYC